LGGVGIEVGPLAQAEAAARPSKPAGPEVHVLAVDLVVLPLRCDGASQFSIGTCAEIDGGLVRRGLKSHCCANLRPELRQHRARQADSLRLWRRLETTARWNKRLAGVAAKVVMLSCAPFGATSRAVLWHGTLRQQRLHPDFA